MDQEPDVMKEEPEIIRQQIDETRSSLTDKLETLEHQVRGTVQDAKTTVEDTIESVKCTVQDTVQSVKRTFDLNHQVEQHPWTMVGGSLLAGFILGSLTGGHGEARREGSTRSGFSSLMPSFSAGSTASPGNGAGTSGPVSEPARSASKEPGFLDKLTDQFDEEIQQVKALAIGAVFGILRDLAKEAVPPTLAPQVEKIMDSATTKMGGKPISGPVVDMSSTGSCHHEDRTSRMGGYANPVT